MRQLLLIVTIFFTARATHGQAKPFTKMFIDTTVIFEYEWNSINIGFPTDNNTGSEVISDSNIQIDTITKNDFAKLSEHYSSKIYLDTTVIFRTDSSFTLKNKNFKKTFSAYRICECTASTYLGLLKPLNLYIVNSVDMHNEIAYSNLIDSKTGKSYRVPSCSDPGPKEILLSPNNGFLLTYDNTSFGHDNCCIYILTVDFDKSKPNYTFNNYVNLNFDRLNIDKLSWVNEKCFIMSVTEQTDPTIYEDEKKLKYCLKITVLK